MSAPFQLFSGIPSNLMTTLDRKLSRLKVANEPAAFGEGKSFRTFKGVTVAQGNTIFFEFVVGVNTTVTQLSVQLEAGAVRLNILSGATEDTAFATPLPVIRKNKMTGAPAPTQQNLVNEGGTATGGTAISTLRVRSDGASVQQDAVGPLTEDQEGLPPGTYHLSLEAFGGTLGGVDAVVVLEMSWEERS